MLVLGLGLLAARSAAAEGAYPGTDYLVAVSAGAALGSPGWGTELNEAAARKHAWAG